jgi:hypothetical protein
MRQARVFACLIIRDLWLVVELQRKPDAPRRLGAVTSNRDKFGTGAGLCAPQVKVTIVAKVEGQQPVEACRVTIADADGVAKLPDARGPASTVIQRDVAPTEAGVIYEVGADASGPVTHGVVDWRRRKTVPEQFVRIRRGLFWQAAKTDLQPGERFALMREVFYME